MSQLTSRLEQVRRTEFSGLGDAAYLNAASLGPLPERARAAMARYGERRMSVQSMQDTDFTEPPGRARESAARLIGASTDEIALGPNTSFGLNLAAMGLHVPTGSTVLVSADEFPANVYPWMNRDSFELHVVPTTHEGWPDEDRILERISQGGVSILAVSSVQFHNGFRADLARLGSACLEHDVFFVVDAIQSLGCIPLDLSSVHADVVACGGHKWLCGPFGSGFAYVRRETQARLRPRAIGWYSMRSARDLESVTDYLWDFVAGASRYEVGTLAVHDQLGLAESLSVLLEARMPAIWGRVDTLLQPLRAWLRDHPDVQVLSNLEPNRRSGIVSFRTPAHDAVFRALKRAGVVCSVREGGIRIAAHFYNTEQDIALLLEVLDARALEGWG